jgi:spore coat protein U-like protein
MKNSRVLVRLAIVSATSLVPSLSYAASATTTSTATVIEPIAITKAADLVFGDFAPGAGGDVTVATNGSRTATGAILSTAGATPTAAKFDVTGNADSTYSISTSAAASLSDSATTPNTMALTVFSDLTGGGATTGEVSSGTLSTGGTQSIYLGGKLTVGATQVAGTYTGDVTVTVEYN